jgi:Ca-activated chloride channel family protein
MAKVEGYPPTHAEFEEDTLKLIAETTRGDYAKADDFESVKSIYEDLSQGVVQQRKEIEISVVLVAFAGVLLMASAALSLTWHGHLA